MKIWDFITLTFLGILLGLAMFVGLKLDDNAQQIKESKWERFVEIDNDIR